MVTTLNANDPNQVASASAMEVLLGEPAQRLMIFSGIAIPDFWTNHDEEVKQGEIVVRLGVHVATLDGGVVHVGLASIKNDETNFLFALDTARLEVEPATGELLIRVTAAVLGEQTSIHRFGYQAVARVHKVSARIAGTIMVPKAILDLSGWNEADLPSLFQISANTVEFQGPQGSMSFGWEKITPVASGTTADMRQGQKECFVDYAIDGCPFSVPLRVLVNLAGNRWPSDAVCGQVRGPNPVLLTNIDPEASGVDFSVGRLPPVR